MTMTMNNKIQMEDVLEKRIIWSFWLILVYKINAYSSYMKAHWKDLNFYVNNDHQ